MRPKSGYSMHACAPARLDSAAFVFTAVRNSGGTSLVPLQLVTYMLPVWLPCTTFIYVQYGYIGFAADVSIMVYLQ
jgi:hypothetical protein